MRSRMWGPWDGRHRAVLLAALVASVAPTLASAQKPSVYFPVDHVVCDRTERVCYDPLGASPPLTAAHLGDNAGKILARRIKKAGKEWDPNHFVLTNGVECLVEKKTCYVQAGSDEVDKTTTEALFGGR